ncbi:craniofacial development protein 2-like [Sitophilus oryzae]|uniref:Craniofacial development protein 2-like n=1 Tax=Sitophilus oryzae TaxID=7048 RepID=A0A6J2YMS0_SITOR|nr:craniofacial development protein 2-like [Sitophilus oryzae]
MAGKLANVETEMRRMQIDILGMSEVRWPGSGKQATNNGVIYYSGGTDTFHQYGTAILVSKDIDRSVMEFIPFNDRVMLLKLQTTHRTLNIIQVYAPTNDKSDAEVEDFYSTLEEAMKLTKKGEINMVMGDFNAKIGSGRENDVVGEYGLGTRNARGDKLIQFCVESNLFIANTCFKQHPRRLYTWKSPADKKGRTIRNLIDFILVGQELKKYVQSVKTYPGADVNSDHNPVVMDFRMRRFKRSLKRNQLLQSTLENCGYRMYTLK